jgi:hypothetical protein
MRPSRSRAVIRGGSLLVLLASSSLSTHSVDRSALSPVVAAEGREDLDARRPHAEYGNLPMAFEANEGQTDPQVRFQARGVGYGLFLTPTEVVLCVAAQRADPPEPRKGTLRVPSKSVGESLRMMLVGGSAHAVMEGAGRLETTTNYLIGNDPSRWRTNVTTYARVRYREMYPGIDLVFYGNQRELEYDFIVAPGADASRIGLRFSGARDVRLDEKGDLILAMGSGAIRQRKPTIYQELNGDREIIPGEYTLTADGEVRLAIGEYDDSRPLVIDPVLVYSTYLGGGIASPSAPSVSAIDDASGIVVDLAGNAYVTGGTQSLDFPTKNALQPAANEWGDIFITKINPAGTGLVYSTFLGGSGFDSGTAIAIDSAGNAYVAGLTRSPDLPVVNAFQPIFGGGNALTAQDAFVAKLNAAGSGLVYSTYLGGSGDDSAFALTVDASQHAYVSGVTLKRTFFPPPDPQNDFPVFNALQPTSSGTSDAFVTKLTPSGSALVYSTYLGGSVDETAFGIATTPAGEVLIAGYTTSPDFPTVAPFQPTHGGQDDAFVAKLAGDGSELLYSSYLGGTDREFAHDIAVDAAGEAVVVGWTLSTDFPVATPIQPNLAGQTDGFVTKVNGSGSALVYSTYLGGARSEFADAVAMDSDRHAIVVGVTDSPDFPLSSALQPQLGSEFSSDAFVTELDSLGSTLVFSTFLGGQSSDSANAVAVDHYDSAYIAGGSHSRDFPVTPGAFQATMAGGESDAFIAKIGTPFPCSPDVTNRVGILPFPAIGIPFTLWHWQLVLVWNRTTDDIVAPLAYVLTNLSNAVAVVSGATTCVAGVPSPFATMHAGSDGVLSAGEVSATVLLFFKTQSGPISYDPVVLSGAPPR